MAKEDVLVVLDELKKMVETHEFLSVDMHNDMRSIPTYDGFKIVPTGVSTVTFRFRERPKKPEPKWRV